MHRKPLLLIFISIIWMGCATKQINQVSFEKYISDLPLSMSDKITFYKDISYDTSQVTVFDLFAPKSSKKTPLVIFIHGGGFTGGDKTDVYHRGKFTDEIIALTSKGIAYATVNYRLLGSSDAKSVMSCLNDAKRCLQFIRYHAKDFNVDESRIGLYGGSAGAGTSLWLGMTEDMKDNKSKDPLERKSTRVKAVAVYATQASYDLGKWDDIFSDYSMTDADVAKIIGHQKIAGFYGVASAKDIGTKEMVTMRKNLDLGDLISADDPPLWIQNPLKTDQKPSNLNEMYHHYKHGEYLYNLSKNAGIKVYTKLPAKPLQSENWIELAPFFIKYL
jgi:para-nitrobenzyl esterase